MTVNITALHTNVSAQETAKQVIREAYDVNFGYMRAIQKIRKRSTQVTALTVLKTGYPKA